MYISHKRFLSTLYPHLPKTHSIGLLPDRQYGALRMRRECREGLSRHQLQRKLLVSDPGIANP